MLIFVCSQNLDQNFMTALHWYNDCEYDCRFVIAEIMPWPWSWTLKRSSGLTAVTTENISSQRLTRDSRSQHNHVSVTSCLYYLSSILTLGYMLIPGGREVVHTIFISPVKAGRKIFWFQVLMRQWWDHYWTILKCSYEKQQRIAGWIANHEIKYLVVVCVFIIGLSIR